MLEMLKKICMIMAGSIKARAWYYSGFVSFFEVILQGDSIYYEYISVCSLVSVCLLL